jgi:alpha-methylacyl-CoA racemase
MSALEGLRVLDLTRLLPGGFCSLLLADFGADVIKVEDTGAGDYVRYSPPHYEGAEPTASSALFLALNRGKRSISRSPTAATSCCASCATPTCCWSPSAPA